MADRDRPPGDRPERGNRPNKDNRGGRPRRDGERPAYGGPRRDGERPAYGGPRREGDRPAYGGPRREGDRPAYGGPRREGGRPPYRGPRPEGDRPDRPAYGGPRRDGGQSFERPRREGGDRPPFDRPRREAGDRPPSDRPRFDRPRPQGDRPPYPRREAGQSFDRPRRDDRPQGSDQPWADPPRRDSRPPFDRGEGGRPQFDRPRGPRPPGRGDWQARDQRRPTGQYGARPPRAASADTSELIGEDEELIAGRRPVEEAFAARREAVRLLVVPERRAALDALVIHATTLRIPVVELEGGSLTALAGFDGHQGVALVARPRPTATVDEILGRARQLDQAPFVLVLDSLEDPQNFGTLLRSAEAVGVHGVLYPTRGAAPLSPAAIKASAGATEHLLLAPVDDLPGALADLHTRGVRIAAAEEGAAMTYTDADFRGPLALVVGSEGKGISGPVRRRLDLSVRIPMHGKIGSLNAAVAGSVLLFAAAQQRPMPAGQPVAAEPDVQPDVEPSPEADSQAAPPTKADVKPTRKRAAKATAQADIQDEPAVKPARKRTTKAAVESPDIDAQPDDQAATELLPAE